MRRLAPYMIPLFSLIILGFGNSFWPEKYSYHNQNYPEFITRENGLNKPITDAGATLGRVLFYDKKLSANLKTSCSSCHKQEYAFGDTASFSTGFEGDLTLRHSMRLVNIRFGDETKFFWNERASSLEEQATAPIKDAKEMGFSGKMGQANFNELIERLENDEHYPNLFFRAFGTQEITEDKIQLALAQFMRSIQSFDSRFDYGLKQSKNMYDDFPNFSKAENLGKRLFLNAPKDGGMGCQGCHQAPEFSINPNTGNNGIIDIGLNPDSGKIASTRSPSLRDLFNPGGKLNGPMMHNASMNSIAAVINHYQNFPLNPLNGIPAGGVTAEIFSRENKVAVEAFLKTLSGTDLYTNPKWSSPFNEKGELQLDSLYRPEYSAPAGFSISSTEDQIILSSQNPLEKVEIFGLNGVKIQQITTNEKSISLAKTTLSAKIIVILVEQGGEVHAEKLYTH